MAQTRKKAESIYSYTPTTGVMVDEFRSDDGWKYVCASALMGVSSEHHRLYSPNGNLRVIMGGASKPAGLTAGALIMVPTER